MDRIAVYCTAGCSAQVQAIEGGLPQQCSQLYTLAYLLQRCQWAATSSFLAACSWPLTTATAGCTHRARTELPATAVSCTYITGMGVSIIQHTNLPCTCDAIVGCGALKLIGTRNLQWRQDSLPVGELSLSVGHSAQAQSRLGHLQVENQPRKWIPQFGAGSKSKLTSPDAGVRHPKRSVQ